MTNGDKLNALFRALRRSDLVARQNHLCCGGCAAASVGEMARARGLRGAVYYHRQDGERLRPSRSSWTSKPAESVFLGFGSSDGDESVTVEIGAEICRVAQQIGLATKWDGTAWQRVEVLLPGGVDAESGPTLSQLRVDVAFMDDAIGIALVEEYGLDRALDARFWHDGVHPAAVRALIAKRDAAAERLRCAIEEGVR